MEPTANDNTKPQVDDASDTNDVPGMNPTASPMDNMDPAEPAAGDASVANELEPMPRTGKSELKPMMMDKDKMMGKHDSGEKKHSHKKTYIIIAVIFLALGMVIGYVAYDLDIRAYYNQYYKNRQEAQQQNNDTSMINDEEDPENPDSMMAEGLEYSFEGEAVDFSFYYPEGYQIGLEPEENSVGSLGVEITSETDAEASYRVAVQPTTLYDDAITDKAAVNGYDIVAAAGAVMSSNECYDLGDPQLENVADREVYVMTFKDDCVFADTSVAYDETGYVFEVDGYYVLVSGDTENLEAMRLTVETFELTAAEAEVTPTT